VFIIYDFTVVLNSEAIIVEYEDRADLLGYAKDEVIGKNWFEVFISSPDMSKAKEVFSSLFEKKEISKLDSYANDIRKKNCKHVLIDFDNQMFFDSNSELFVRADDNEHYKLR